MYIVQPSISSHVRMAIHVHDENVLEDEEDSSNSRAEINDNLDSY